MTVEAHGRSENGRVTTEVILPEAVIENHRPHRIVGPVGPPQNGVHAQEVEQAAGRPTHAYLPGMAGPREVLLDERHPLHLCQGLDGPKIRKIAARKVSPRHAAHVDGRRHHHQALRRPEVQRAKDDRVHHREERGIEPYAQAEGEYDHHENQRPGEERAGRLL